MSASHAEVIADRSLGVATPMSFQQAIWNNVWKHQTPPSNVLLGQSGPRKSKIFEKAAKTAGPIPFHMESHEYEKRIKMLSMNPCVYGNIYGVLGSS